MIKKLLLGFVILVVVALVVIYFTLDSIVSSAVKYAINEYGPKATQTEVTVESVSISPFTGAGTISDLVIGNPKAFEPPAEAFTLGEISLSIDPASLLTDKIIVKDIRIIDAKFNYVIPSITQIGSSNLDEILKNVRSFAGSSEAKEEAPEPAPEADGETAPSKPSKKLVIKSIHVEGATAMARVGTDSVELDIPTISLQDDSEEGITPAMVTDKVLADVMAKLIPAITEELMKDPEKLLKGAMSDGSDGLEGAVDAVKGLFE